MVLLPRNPARGPDEGDAGKEESIDVQWWTFDGAAPTALP
jgi:hypothetical protein